MTSLPLSAPHHRTAIWLTRAGQLALAALLFSSPWMIQWVDIHRRVSSIFAGYSDFYLYPSDIFLVLTVVLGLAGAQLGGRLRFGPWYLTLPLAALVALSWIGVPFGVDPALTFYHSVRFLLLFGLYLVLVNLPVPAWLVAAPLGLAVLVQSVVAILQFTRQSSLGLGLVGELTLNPADTGASILRYDNVRILRAYGLTDHPNLLGGFLAFALILLIGYYLRSADNRSSSNARSIGRLRYVYLIPIASGVVALFYSFSRAAELAFLVGLILMAVAVLWARPAPVPLRELAIVGLVLVVPVIVPILNNQRLIAQRAGQGNSFEDNVGEVRSLLERDELISSANRIFYQRQFLGVGNGALALAEYSLDKDFPKSTYYYQPAHVVILDAAAELGLFGGFAWGWLMLAPLVVMRVRRRLLSSDPWAAAVAASLLALLIIGFFDYYPWFWASGRLWQWTAFGLFAALMTMPERTRARGQSDSATGAPPADL